MIKAIIFDCFGVIYNDAAKVAFDKLGGNKSGNAHEFERSAKAWALGLIGRDEIRAGIAEALGVTVQKWKQTVEESKGYDERMMEYILSHKGNYKTGLLTNMAPGELEVYFPEPIRSKHFDGVVSSGEVGMVKPDPAIYELIASRLNVELSEAVFVDDNEHYVQGAKSAGMQGVCFDNFTSMKKDLQEILDA